MYFESQEYPLCHSYQGYLTLLWVWVRSVIAPPASFPRLKSAVVRCLLLARSSDFQSAKCEREDLGALVAQE